MDSSGTINTNYIVEYDENCENHENLDNKFIIKVKSSNLDDVIILFKEPNFERFIREAFNCFIVCVEFDNNEEEEEVDDEYTAMRLEGTFKADILVILQLNQNLWIKKCLQKKFFDMRSPKMRKYQKLLDDLNFDENILNAKLKLSSAIDYIRPETEDFVIKIIKLFKFDNQKEVDGKLFDVAIEQKCSFEIIKSMISFHKESLNGMTKHEVDALFLAKGISVFDEHIIDNYKQELRNEDKEKITDEIEKFHGNKKSLLQHLCSRSKIALNSKGTEDERLKKIEEYYSQLIDFNLDSVTDLLKIVDHKLLIVFDFDSNSIERSYLMGSKSNRGIFDQDRRKIFIGAKNSFDPSSQDYKKREWEIIGILIHEICHSVNFKVFNNNCKPYHKDERIKQEYEKIINEYKSWTDQHEIVGRVFSDYEETMWHAELIVRAVQMIVTYKVLDPKNLEKLEEKYQKLFKYFNDTVMPEIKEYLNPDNQLRRITKEISSVRLDQLEIKPVMQQINYDKEKIVHFVETNSLKLAMANFHLNFQDDFAIFTTFADLMDKFRGTEILSLWCSDWRIKIVIFCDQVNENSKHFEECIKKLDNPDRLNQIFIIFEEQSENLLQFKGKFTKKIEIMEKLSFGFSNLTEESKEIILQKDVIFQGIQVKLNQIITKDSKAAQFLPINHFLESSEQIVIGKLPEKNAEYDDKVFIQRKLTNKISEQFVEFSTEKMDEILSLLSTKQYIIISDEVGKGKSTLMTFFAYQFLQSSLSHIEGKFFVVKINLHQHTNVLERFKDDKTPYRFIFDNFVSNSKFKELEWTIFEEYYQNGKLILMLDGFDEIAPNCEEQTFRIIHLIIDTKTSNVIVATRPLFIQKLNISNDFILNLELLSIQEQLNYLTNFLKSHEEIETLYSKTEIVDICKRSLVRIQKSVSETLDSKRLNTNQMMSFPLHLKMFAGVILNKILKNKFNFDEALKSITSFNVYDLYDDFFGIKQAIALKDKGEIVENEIINLERKGFKRLQLFDSAGKLAWNTLHPAFKLNPIEINEREKKYLQRYGIVTIQNNEIYFVHRSYAEFIIAHMFLKNIIDGTLSSSLFAQDHFWIDVLTKVDHETIKNFIDTALTKNDIYRDISEESLENLGKFVIKEFEELEGNNKNFLYCVIDYKDEKFRSRKDFVFISHLLINSLMFCDTEHDIGTIKNILQMPWHGNCDRMGIRNFPLITSSLDTGFNSSPSELKDNGQANIFHLVCKMGLNSLILSIWKLAEKVYGNEAKNYFFIKCLLDRKEVNVFELAFDTKQTKSDNLSSLRNIRNCYEIEELRKVENIQEENDINLSEECNFHLSTVFCLLQIIKKFNLTVEELEFLCSNYDHRYSEKNTFLNLHFYFYLISNFFNSKISENLRVICYVVFNAICTIIDIRKLIHGNVEVYMSKIFKFSKEKLSSDYKKFIKDLFVIFFESEALPFWYWRSYDMEPKARILFLELKEVCEDSDEILQYFKNNQKLPFSLMKIGDYIEFNNCLNVYFKVLDHLAFLLFYENQENFNIFNFNSKFEMKCLEHFFSFLKKRFPDNDKPYYIIEESNMLSYAALNEEKFMEIYEFFEKNFDKTKILNLLFSLDFGCKIYLKCPSVCNIVINLFMESFGHKKWKIFFFKKYQNNATIILQMLNNDWIESGKILISVAKQKLSKLEFSRLMRLKDGHNNSIMSMKKLKKFG